MVSTSLQAAKLKLEMIILLIVVIHPSTPLRDPTACISISQSLAFLSAALS